MLTVAWMRSFLLSPYPRTSFVISQTKPCGESTMSRIAPQKRRFLRLLVMQAHEPGLALSRTCSLTNWSERIEFTAKSLLRAFVEIYFKHLFR